MKQQCLCRRLGLTLGLLAAAFILPSFARAAGPKDTTDPGFYIALARQAERDAKWDKACEFYAEALSLNKNQPAVKKSFLHCLRNFHRVFRHSDSSFRQQLLNPQFHVREALEFYNDILCKVQNTYFDEQRTELTNLFREGLKELLMALDDREFQATYIGKKGVSDADIQAFRAAVAMKWENTTVASRKEAEENVRAIIKAGADLRLNGKAVVVEFACGACNALDEYSFYLTQGALAAGDREEKTVPVVELYEGSIGYVRLNGFGDTTVGEIEAAYEHLRSSGMKVMVLDLRYNLGGDLDVAADVARRFLPAPALIGSVSGKNPKSYRSFSMTALDMPIYLLVDGNTASAAELLASAFKTHDRAKLVGENTFGKNQVQKMVPIYLNREAFGAVRLTWGQFYGPDKQDLSKTGGVSPTFRVSGGAIMADRQLDEALERARAHLMMR